MEFKKEENMKNKGFTLAEVLVVLSVIGILATVSLGVLSKMTPDKTKIKFRKAHQIVERTVAELINDEHLYPYNPNSIGFRNTDPVTWPGSEEIFSGNTKFCELFKRKLNSSNIVDTGSMGCGNITTTDGITYFPPSDNNSYVNKITYERENVLNYYPMIIDINGTENGPNTGFTSANNPDKPWEMRPVNDNDNRDRYIMYIKYDGRIEVTGDKEIRFLRSDKAHKE